MSENDAAGSTRRDTLKYGATIAAGLGLAGCSDVANQAGGNGTPTGSGSYTAEMAPAGTVTFDEVPEDVFTILSHHVDMALSLGYGDDLNAMHAPEYVQSLYEKFTTHLDGVDHDWSDLYSSWPPTKEKLYELDSDVHLADPAKVSTADSWDDGDIEDIERDVAPWFGNTFSDTYQEPPESWADEYQYYSLWEIFANVADVFQAQARSDALASVHEELVGDIESGLPPESERPSAAMVLFSTTDDRKWGYRLNQPGYYAAHTRPLGVTDALADVVSEDAHIDFEVLLEADPDVLLVLGPMSSYHSIETIRETLANDEVASEMTAVRNDRVYTQGARRQGPLLNLFQLEMTAKQLYPDQFGKWPEYVDGEPYPEIPAEEQLFDRQRVSDIVNGDI